MGISRVYDKVENVPWQNVLTMFKLVGHAPNLNRHNSMFSIMNFFIDYNGIIPCAVKSYMHECECQSK